MRALASRVLKCAAALALASCSAPPSPPPLDPRALLAELREGSPALPADGIDPDTAVALALAHDPVLASLRDEQAITAALARAEAAWRNPEFRPSFANLVSSASQPASLALGLRLFLPRPGESDARDARAAALAAKGAATLDWCAAQTEARVRVAHARVVALEQEVVLAEAAGQLHERIVVLVGALLEARAATRADESLALLRREELADERGELAAELAGARAELAVLIGASPGAPVAVRRGAGAPTIESLPSELPSELQEAVEPALDRRGDLRALQHEHEAAQQALRRVRGAHGFWPSFLEPKAERDSRSSSLGLAAGFELPLFDSADAETAVAEARVQLARSRYMAGLANAHREIELARVLVREAERRRRRQAATLTPLLAEVEALVQTMLTSGEGDPQRLLLLEARRLDAQRVVARAWFDAESARVGFALASGGLAAGGSASPRGSAP